MFRDEVKTKMHGFLNVLGAAVLAAEHSWDEQQTAAMLEDEDAKSFSFDDDSFAWREWKIATNRHQSAPEICRIIRQLQLRRTARRFARLEFL